MRPLLLEHANLNVPDREAARRFYVDVLCGRLNPASTNELQLHVNVGVSQLHLPTVRSVRGRETVTVAQRWGGRLELLTAEPLAAVAERARAAGHGVCAHSTAEGGGVAPDGLEIDGPWGNSFLLRAAPDGLADAVAARRGHAGGSGPLLALSAAVMSVPPGSAARLGRFYSRTLGLEVEEGPGRLAVPFDSGLPGLAPQRLVFEEAADAPPADLYDREERAAVHISIYLPDEASFAAAFTQAEAAGAVYVNPRFEGLPAEFGSAATLGEALACWQFRVKDCADPETSELGLVLEHEIRCPRHVAFPLGAADEANGWA